MHIMWINFVDSVINSHGPSLSALDVKKTPLLGIKNYYT